MLWYVKYFVILSTASSAVARFMWGKCWFKIMNCKIWMKPNPRLANTYFRKWPFSVFTLCDYVSVVVLVQNKHFLLLLHIKSTHLENKHGSPFIVKLLNEFVLLRCFSIVFSDVLKSHKTRRTMDVHKSTSLKKKKNRTGFKAEPLPLLPTSRYTGRCSPWQRQLPSCRTWCLLLTPPKSNQKGQFTTFPVPLI